MTEVFKAEKILANKGATIKVIPVPRHLSSDCGVAISIACFTVKEIERVLNDEKLSYAHVMVLE